MSDSRISKVGELLLRRQGGDFLPERRVDDACRQLAGRVERRFPGALHTAHGEEGLRGLLDSLTELLVDDYRARELMNAIVPREPEPAGGRRQRILFLNALPIRAEVIRGGHEHNEIRSALSGPRYREKLALRAEWGVRIGDLQRYLLEHEPDIVHFSGHGDERGILLEQNNGDEWFVTGVELAALFGIIKGIRCIVMNACATSPHAASIARVIGSAVSWRGDVPDDVAILFAKHFYQALAFGRTLQDAFDLGCWQIPHGEQPWELPELFGDASMRLV